MGSTRRVMAGGAAVVLLAASAVVFVASSASAQIQTLEVDGDLISFTENLWDVSAQTSVTAEECVSDPVVHAASINGDPVTIVSQVEVDNTTTRVTLPQDAAAGEITWAMSCVITAGPTSGVGTDLYASAAITKVVQGDFPADTVFTVNVNCPAVALTATTFDGDVDSQLTDDELNADFSYPVAGATLFVFVDQERSCNITEPGNGGATSTVIDPETLTFPTPANFEATITNVLVEPVVVEPVVVVPTFTG